MKTHNAIYKYNETFHQPECLLKSGFHVPYENNQKVHHSSLLTAGFPTAVSIRAVTLPTEYPNEAACRTGLLQKIKTVFTVAFALSPMQTKARDLSGLFCILIFWLHQYSNCFYVFLLDIECCTNKWTTRESKASTEQ